MSEDKIYNKVITIESKEESKTANGNTMVKITDHTREKFSFFKKKKDGSFSAVAEQFRDMELDEGSMVRIGYVIETYQDKKGVTRESHKIINFQETSDTPTETAPRAEKPRSEAPNSSQRLSEAEFSRRLGVQGHVNALLSNPGWCGSGIEWSAKHIVEEAIRIEDEINKQLNPSKLRQAVERHAPQVASPVDDEWNPMVNDEPPIEAYDEKVEGVPF